MVFAGREVTDQPYRIIITVHKHYMCYYRQKLMQIKKKRNVHAYYMVNRGHKIAHVKRVYASFFFYFSLFCSLFNV